MTRSVSTYACAAAICVLAAANLVAQGRLLVSSRGDNRVLAYDPSTGAYLGVFISDPAHLSGPGGLAFGPDGDLYVAGTDTNQVLRYDGITGAFKGGLAFVPTPVAVAWGPGPDIFVTGGMPASAVFRFSADGKPVAAYGGPGFLNAPAGIAVTGNDLYIANSGANNVVHFLLTGEVRAPLGVEGRMVAPIGVAVGPDGNVYVASAGLPEIQRYSPDGRFLDIFGTGPDLVQPLALAFGLDGNLYVTTRQNTVVRLDGRTGASMGVFVGPGSGGLNLPVALAFSTSGDTGPALTMQKVSGDHQETDSYRTFTYPLVVQVNSPDGSPASGQRVNFTATEGPAYLRGNTAVTDKQGRASVAVDPGFGTGGVTVTASAGSASVFFALAIKPTPGQTDPHIDAVLHAARMGPIGSAGYELAQGAGFVLTGRNLAAPDAVTVRTVTGDSSSAVVLSAEPARLTAMLPPEVPPGEVDISVTSGAATSTAFRAIVVPANFGIYTRNRLGYGPAVATAYDDADASWAPGLASPVHPGDRVSLAGTGLGQTDASALEVIVGGQVVAPSSATVGTAGDEVVFQVPDGIAPGCYVPVAVRSGSLLSNFAALPVAAAGAPGCDHPLRLPVEVLSALDEQAPVLAGILGLIRLPLSTALGSGYFVAQGGTFASFDANSLFAPAGVATSVTDGACTVFQMAGGMNVAFPVPLARGLDAGQVTVRSPDGSVAAVPRRGSGLYDQSGFLNASAASSEVLAGRWTIAGRGGPDVESFEAPLDVPAPVEWTNPDAAILIDRSRDLTITWDASGDNRPDHVVFSGLVMGNLPLTYFPVHVQFACAAPFGDGSLTVPAAILSQLPPTSDQTLGLAFLANAAFDSRTRAFDARTTGGAVIPVTAAGYVVGRGVASIYR